MVMPLASDYAVDVAEVTEQDEFSEYYADFLDGSYDCVDRIVLNAYFPLIQTAAGWRFWWRQTFGSDEDLDKNHLMRIAGRFARRLRTYAEKKGIAVIETQKGDRKHEIAVQYLPQEPDFVGVFVILVGHASVPVFDVKRNQGGTITDIQRKYAYVKQYYFHIMDPEWGHIIIKFSPHPPFGAQIILNGHEYVAQQARTAGLEFSKEGNCLTDISDPTRLAQIAETLRSENIVGQLSQLGERWLYSACLCFALSLEEQERSGFQYQYSTYQMEYSRNLLFHQGSQMEQLVQGIIDRIRAALEVKTLKTIFGYKHRPSHRRNKKGSRLEVVVEKPEYDLTVLKIHFGKLTVKLYTKGERVLRIEAIVHNTKALPFGRSLPNFPQIATHLKEIVDRFLNVSHCVDKAFISDDSLDNLHTSSQVGKTRVGGVNLHQPRLRAVIEAVISLAAAPYGFTVSDLTAKVRQIMGLGPTEYTPRQASYDLKKLRGKNLVRKKDRSHKYEVVPNGLRTMIALVRLRDQVIKPILAGLDQSEQEAKPVQDSQLDMLYQAIRMAMRNLFQAIGIAV